MDAGDGERGLGDVGRKDDAVPGVRLEDALLFGGGEASVERDDLDLPQLLGEVFLCLADLPLARQKAEDVARRFPEQGAGRPFDSLRHIEDWRVRIVGVAERLIPDLDGVGAARHLDDRGIAESGGELGGVDGGRGDDQMKVVATFDESPQVTEQEVDVERPFVGFVDDDRVVPTQIRSRWSSARRMPSVIAFTSVRSLTSSVKRTE